MALDHTAAFKPVANKESYRILVDWPHSDYDIDFEGKTGNIHLEVIATQVDASNAQLAREKYEAVNEAFLALDKVHSNTLIEGTLQKLNLMLYKIHLII